MRIENVLSAAASPYLRQHAANPVAWQVWGDAAIALARRERRPILLSIGYAACHWCHVMARESFADPGTAESMNRLFVNVKVDREERPDLDRVYQLAHQVLTGRGGGWPLTSFLDPETLVPFFSGTYFPDTPRYGMPSFSEVLDRVAAYYHDHGDDIAARRDELIGLVAAGSPRPAEPCDGASLDLARQQLEQRYDTRHGGFGGAPKFPQPGHVDRLLRHWRRQRSAGRDDPRALEMAVGTLEAMARGGLYDQLAGGFFRYSVDERWEIPHFEKMLSDNGLLLALYAQAWAVTGRPLFRRVVDETAGWLRDEMRAEGGGFHASLDADVEGREGGHYVWRRDEVRRLLGGDGADRFFAAYGLDGPANFEGAWHLRLAGGAAPAIPVQDADRDPAAGFDVARRRLLEARRRRPRPARDDKILAGWNALAIRGLAIAARHTGDPGLREAAFEAFDAVRRRLWRNGRLFVAWCRGEAAVPAFLDDHAYLADAGLELLQLDWRGELLVFVRRLAEAIVEGFFDPETGGFLYSTAEHATPILRPQACVDDALPAAGGVAARLLGRLGLILDEADYHRLAESAVTAAGLELAQTPAACGAMLSALEERSWPPEIVVVRGSASEIGAWHERVLSDYAPGRLVFAIDADCDDVPAGLAAYRPAGDGGPLAYLCRGASCMAPFRDLDALVGALSRP